MPDEEKEQTQQLVKSKTESQEINAFTRMPETFEEAKEYCEYLSSSNLVPKGYQGKPQDIFVCVSMGQQVGLTHPMMALKNISVINGRPAMWGDAPLALVRSNPLCEFILEDNEAFAYARDKIPGWKEKLKDVDMDSTSVCVGKRVGEAPQAREFSVEEIETAGLKGQNVHKKYPKDMRKYKARDRLLRSLFADVVEGIAQAELVKEQEELQGDAPDDFEDGLDEPDDLGQELAEGLEDPEVGKGKKDVQDAEIIEEQEDEEDVPDNDPDGGGEAESGDSEQDAESSKKSADDEPKKKWVKNKTVQDIVKSAKYLPNKQSNKLAKLIGKQNGRLRPDQAKKWQDEIRAAHEKAKEEKKNS